MEQRLLRNFTGKGTKCLTKKNTYTSKACQLSDLKRYNLKQNDKKEEKFHYKTQQSAENQSLEKLSSEEF